MITPDQIDLLISENVRLKASLDEMNAILYEREEVIGLLREANARTCELQSRFDMQLEGLYSMQNIIGGLEQKAEGAAGREGELEEELYSAMGIRKEYDELLHLHIHLQTKYEDILNESAEWQKKALNLEKKAAKLGELESELAELNLERDLLTARIADLEKTKSKHGFIDELSKQVGEG